jgi:glyoxylase I family protein
MYTCKPHLRAAHRRRLGRGNGPNSSDHRRSGQHNLRVAVERVTGIGGFFFRARDPDALSVWYADHLGVVAPTGNYEDPGWFLERGETVFAAFPHDSDAFGSPEKIWKINFRVRDLDAMVSQLRAAGIEVRPHDRDYPNGRFADLEDPEGNQIQIWEPNAASLARDPLRRSSP